MNIINFEKFEFNSTKNVMDNFRLIIQGPSACGKSVLIKKILWDTRGTFDDIFLICPTMFQPLWEKQVKIPDDHKSDKATNEQFKKFYKMVEENHKNKKRSLIICDDVLYTDLTKDRSALTEVFTRIRHQNCSIIVVGQLYKGLPPVLRSNATHIAVFKNPSKDEEKKMQSELGDAFIEMYDDVCNKPYAFVWANLTKNEMTGERYGDKVDF